MKLQILRLLVGLAVLGVLLAVIWVLGGLLEPKENEHRITLAVMLGVALLFLVAVGLAYLKSLRSAASIESSLRAGALAQFAGARPDKQGEVDELRKQFETALDGLRRSKRGKTALHALPLYVLVGPPGSGKTTMLRESGIEFPFMAGRREIRGVGGTRNCDWWFGARGIMLDTAGRYMVEQDDREEWLAFLSMIRKARGRRAIDGAVVAISLGDILAASETELRSHAEMVRERVDELTQQLGVVFPVYLVFTKCDQLAGFVEFFERLTKEERKQVWGFSVPLGEGGGVAAAFPAEFDGLYRLLARRRLQDFAAERGRKKKEKSYSFPLQFALVKQRVSDFLGLLGQANPYQEASPLRGVYFTSGTQEGTVISQLQRTIYEAAEMAIDIPPDQRKTYFIDDLFEKVVFGDAGLAEPTAATRRRLRIMSLAGLAAAVLFGAWLAWMSITRFVTERSVLNHQEAAIRAVDGQIGPWRGAGGGGSSAPLFEAPLLDAMAALEASRWKDPDAAPEGTVDPGDVVGRAFFDAMRTTLVSAAAQRAIDAARASFVALEPADQASLKGFKDLSKEYGAANKAADEWRTALHLLTNTGAMQADNAARLPAIEERIKTAWLAGIGPGELERFRVPALRWLDRFLAIRETDGRAVAKERRDILKQSEFDASLENQRANLGRRWESFRKASLAEKLPSVFQPVPMSEGLSLADLGLPPQHFEGDPRLALRFRKEVEFRDALAAELEALKDVFGKGPDAASRQEYIASLQGDGAAALQTSRVEAWRAFLVALKPKPLSDWRDIDPWTAGDPGTTVTERVVAAIESAVHPPPVGDIGSVTPFASPLRDAAAFVNAARADLPKRERSVEQTLGVMDTFLDGMRLIHTPAITERFVSRIGSGLATSMIALEGSALACVERMVAGKLQGSLEVAWAVVLPKLNDARQEFPFNPAGLTDPSVSDASVDRVRHLLGPGSPYELLDRIATSGQKKLRDDAVMLTLGDTASGLLRKLRALRAAFSTEGPVFATLKARPYTSRVDCKFVFLDGQTIDRNTLAHAFRDYSWPPKKEQSATIVVWPRDGFSMTVENLDGPLRPPGPQFEGLWSLVRLFHHGAPHSQNPNQVMWQFKYDAADLRVGLELGDTPLREFLLEKKAFELPAVPSLF